MIVGTAGHIDHGKSTLIEALTGQTMDRLVDERRRGITIDLNFAGLDLGQRLVAGVIDVPGHEDLVRTMVAGATGIDLVLLVVAADEGIMPQTLEHLAIAEQLGVPHGIPVITKVDTADPEWVELVQADVADRVAKSSIPFTAPVLTAPPVGTGLTDLRDLITQLAARIPPRREDDLFRLPVDRAFSVSGVGTVVTGTCWSGSVSAGDTVRLAPAGPTARVRSVESHGTNVPRAMAGTRVALGLVGVDRDQARRGCSVVAPQVDWPEVRALDVELQLLANAGRAMTPRRRVRLHLGTREVLARVYPRAAIHPGQSGLARLVCDDAVVARSQDRFIIRSYSPVTTIGGGRVVDPCPPRHGGQWPAGLASPDPVERLMALTARRARGLAHGQLALLLGLAPDDALVVAKSAPHIRQVGGHWIPGDRIDALSSQAGDHIRRHHRDRPSDPGMPLETLRAALAGPSWLVAAALDRLAAGGHYLLDGGVARHGDFTPQVSGGAREIDRVVAVLDQAGLTPPDIEALGHGVGRDDVADILRLAAAEGRVVQVERDRYYASSQLAAFASVVKELGTDGIITPARMRERLGVTRKFLIPLLQWSDAQGITRRVGDGRQLVDSPRSERRETGVDL